MIWLLLACVEAPEVGPASARAPVVAAATSSPQLLGEVGGVGDALATSGVVGRRCWCGGWLCHTRSPRGCVCE